MVLIARLAIDAGQQGKGLGRDLLIDAIPHAAAAGQHAAAKFISVDPLDERARSFYQHFGFQSIDGDEHRRMFMRIADITPSLDASDES